MALLLQRHFKPTTHNGAKIHFTEHFIKTQKVDKKFGKLYAQLLTWRHKGDYDDFFDFEEKNVVQYLEPVEEFIRMIENLIGEKKLGN
jgi:uncharacterized protein (UPF0332 family)